MMKFGQILWLAILLGICQQTGAIAATHLTCTPHNFSKITTIGVNESPYNDIHVIIEEKTVTIGIVNNFDVFSDWVFAINWQKGQKLTGHHDDGSLSFDGTILQLAATQLVSGISVLRATCK